ncbi:MAG: hypothetical protein HY689_01865 [Chloroflexi bacterium]|nr:hypothetical protein [Chloroflexota bacterium]
MIAARCWFPPCADPPDFRLVPSDPALLHPETCRTHLGELIASTLERYGLEALTVERIPPGSLIDGFREEAPTRVRATRRQRRGRFTGMQEVQRPDCGHGALVAMYRYPVGSRKAIARAQAIAMAHPCPTCREP